jgi:hypothetical protein
MRLVEPAEQWPAAHQERYYGFASQPIVPEGFVKPDFWRNRCPNRQTF